MVVRLPAARWSLPAEVFAVKDGAKSCALMRQTIQVRSRTVLKRNRIELSRDP